MYLEHFNLSVSPFGISPRLDFLYKSGAFEEGMAHLLYGLESREALVMITGAIGTGKTMAIQSFLSCLGDGYISALVTNTNVDGRELLKLILDDLGAPLDRGADKSDLLIAFKQFMIEAGRQGQRIVIIVDEAQNLTSGVLEEIRLLTNLGQGEDQPVQIILVGQPELATTVDRPDLAQLKQRIRVHCRLSPLSRRELEEYVDHRMRIAGGAPGTFSGAALDRIYAASGGVPRIVNTLCGEGLLSAYVAGRRKVEAKDLDGGQASEAVAISPVERGSASASPPVEALQPAMAARRAEPQDAAAGTGEAAVDGANKGPSASHRIQLVAAFAVLAVIVALAATGRLGPLWPKPTPVASLSGAMDQLPDQPTSGAGDAVTAAVIVDSTVAAAADSSTARRDSTVVKAARRDGSAVSATSVPPRDASALPVAPRPEAAAAVVPAAVTPASVTDTVPESGSVEAGSFFIHVRSLRTTDAAAEVAETFVASGTPASVREQMVNNVLWYRVYLGPYEVRADAVRMANRLLAEGKITYYQVTRLDSGAGS
jgi:type II secretory pathway predicted ATPase ExeA/cell division septation protein DedD